jgi:hypothetical protein
MRIGSGYKAQGIGSALEEYCIAKRIGSAYIAQGNGSALEEYCIAKRIGSGYTLGRRLTTYATYDHKKKKLIN